MKSGMYGEMPIINLGKYSISDMSDSPENETVWISDNETSEGGEFQKSKVDEVIGKLFNKEF